MAVYNLTTMVSQPEIVTRLILSAVEETSRSRP
jgi:hypothetical protein